MQNEVNPRTPYMNNRKCFESEKSHSLVHFLQQRDLRLLSSPHVCMNAQSYLTLCSSMDCSPPGFPVPEIFQARTLRSLPRSPLGASSLFWVSCTGRRLYHFVVVFTTSASWQAPSLPHTYLSLEIKIQLWVVAIVLDSTALHYIEARGFVNDLISYWAPHKVDSW